MMFLARGFIGRQLSFIISNWERRKKKTTRKERFFYLADPDLVIIFDLGVGSSFERTRDWLDLPNDETFGLKTDGWGRLSENQVPQFVKMFSPSMFFVDDDYSSSHVISTVTINISFVDIYVKLRATRALSGRG
ncbi:uncharacterized protein [Anoplolepis gracilipes]|uniref:uncharacterized protein isoform X2 n=1 Tax=Anoplolepis gracilipes TaxID=354296 RepID=UPI003B9EB1FD